DDLALDRGERGLQPLLLRAAGRVGEDRLVDGIWNGDDRVVHGARVPRAPGGITGRYFGVGAGAGAAGAGAAGAAAGAAGAVGAGAAGGAAAGGVPEAGGALEGAGGAGVPGCAPGFFSS